MITNVWRFSHLSNFSPLHNGWVLSNGYFLHKWFDGEETPADMDAFSAVYEKHDELSSDESEFSDCSSDSESDDDEEH